VVSTTFSSRDMTRVTKEIRTKSDLFKVNFKLLNGNMRDMFYCSLLYISRISSDEALFCTSPEFLLMKPPKK
jgi:hypothetical protein